MDFFAQQDNAKRQTGILLGYFCAAVFLTSVLVYFIPLVGWYSAKLKMHPGEQIPFIWWNTRLFLYAVGSTLLVIFCGALYKVVELQRSGGRGIAVLMGGKEILPSTDDFFEKRLRNIVEEMAIASGVPVPPVYVMEHEKGINAFAAGLDSADSVVAVTYGTMTGLTREELQGVIAHEFSHILNNDVKLNISLMGFLHGLLLITLIGQVVMRLGFGSSYYSSRDSKGNGLPFIVGGIALMAIGAVGLLGAKLIKAAVSRSRERLADASAVQFTRDPTGLASALKKIGGLSYGSRIRSPHAEQASHMFFGNGMASNIFNTHPRLEDRVRWLQPNFDGEFEAVTLEDLQAHLSRFESAPKIKKEKKPDVVDLFTDPTKLATATAILDANPGAPPYLAESMRVNEPEKLIETIGTPMEHHAEHARALIESIPQKIKEMARDPYGSRALIHFLLLDEDSSIRKKQIATLWDQSEFGVAEMVEKLIKEGIKIQPELRLPIIDLTIPAMRFLSPDQYATFRSNVKALSDADNAISIFEFSLQRVLLHNLDSVFSKRKKKPVNYYAIKGLENEVSMILSVLARVGQDTEAEVTDAFVDASEKIISPNATFSLVPADQCNWNALEAALDKMNEGCFKVKKWVLGAALVCLMHDGKITIEEVELFRAIADSLGCPVPPWVAVGSV